MTYVNLESKNVKVFPCSAARSTNNYGSVLNEDNITNILKSVTDRENFVILLEDAHNDKSEYIGQRCTFVLEGYYFDIVISEDDWNASMDSPGVWAECMKSDIDSDYTYLVGDSEDNKFKGLSIYTKDPESENALQLLEYDRANGGIYIPPTSKLKFSPVSIEPSITSSNLSDDIKLLDEKIDKFDISSQLDARLSNLDTAYYNSNSTTTDKYHQFITDVKQEDGKVSVYRLSPDNRIILECGNSNIFK